MVGLGRLELPTSRLSGVRSNHLSYRPPTRGTLNSIRAGAKAPADMTPAQGFTTRPLPELRLTRRGRDTKTAAPNATRKENPSGRLKVTKSKRSLASALRILRKEVIQPQVPLRLPCYDFTPVADLTVVGCPPKVSAPA